MAFLCWFISRLMTLIVLSCFILILRRLVCVCFLDRSIIMFVGGKIPILLMFFFSSPFLWLTFPIVFLVVSCNFCSLLYVTMLCYIILSSTILYIYMIGMQCTGNIQFIALHSLALSALWLKSPIGGSRPHNALSR